MRPIPVFVVLALAACSKEDAPQFPPVEGHWSVVNGDVVCDGAAAVETVPTGSGPYTRVECTWHLVAYEGQNRCSVFVTYERSSSNVDWPAPLVFATKANCTNT